MNALLTNLLRFVVLGVFLATAAYLLEGHERDGLLERSKGDPRILAAFLLAKNSHAHTCPAGEQRRGELDVLMSAITIVERFSTSRVERVAEWATLQSFNLIGLQVPDLSVGDGQIRVTTAMKAIGAVDNPETVSLFTRNELAHRMLAACINHDVGVRVLTWIAQEHGLPTNFLSRANILALAAAYNGQARRNELAGILAQQTYNEVTYHLYHSLKFASLVGCCEHPQGTRPETYLSRHTILEEPQTGR